MHAVSAFFTAYSARREGAPVEAVALVVSEGPGAEPILRFVIVDERGRASVVEADELDLFGVIDDAREAEEAIARDREGTEAAGRSVKPSAD
ncbi:MAG TPA: hypothetical protein VEO91_01530 [Candidatus Limnocylindria bacterium]|nr:hypothetical protein [Candidatus Limnocylindria bacterium]